MLATGKFLSPTRKKKLRRSVEGFEAVPNFVNILMYTVWLSCLVGFPNDIILIDEGYQYGVINPGFVR